jgi:glutathione synthase/RimK-type ligase-like ATP-grasp enzyme
MQTIAVVHSLSDWPVDVPGIEVVTARDYLTAPEWTGNRRLRVFNLCRSYAYQSEGYYVSLLGSARGHRPFPDLRSVLDMKHRFQVRVLDEELDERIQRSLADIQGERFELSVYFGTNLARRHARLAQALFAQFPVPMLRASFVRKARDGRWHMTRVAPLSLRDVPDGHREFLAEAMHDHTGRRRRRARTARREARYDLGILYDPAEKLAPSDPRALARFRRAARKVGFDVQMLQKDDYARLAEFDALLLRETTAVDHHTFRFAQRAERLGIVVVDDATSILRSTNKVYQAEALARHKVPIPRTLIVGEVDVDTIVAQIGLPCVLKYPDSSFSQGVVKCEDADQIRDQGRRILAESDLLLAQEYLPTGFDWRVGVFGGEALYACRYLMARGHWQIVKRTGEGRFRHGRVEPVPLDRVPAEVVEIALRAAGAFGDSLYGVDLKVVDDAIYVTEVNDNPNIDAGCEDAVLGEDLYLRIMQGMLDRVRAHKREVVA